MAEFQPTLPARGATLALDIDKDVDFEFQPTLPARGATAKDDAKTESCTFQPTLPARGATEGRRLRNVRMVISTHAPRTGSDTLVAQG